MVPAPGKPDKNLGEFWVGNPWLIPHQNNLSAFERNRVYLNVDGSNFLDISYLTSADSDGDGRCVVALDFNHDGRQDLVVRQVGGGPLMLYENRFPQQHWLRVTLRGVESNRLGIGARLTAVVDGRQLVRELYPANTYRSRSPCLVHFGLGDADRVDKLTIRWPSGKVQSLVNLSADRHIAVQEGNDTVLTVQPGTTIQP